MVWRYSSPFYSQSLVDCLSRACTGSHFLVSLVSFIVFSRLMIWSKAYSTFSIPQILNLFSLEALQHKVLGQRRSLDIKTDHRMAVAARNGNSLSKVREKHNMFSKASFQVAGVVVRWLALSQGFSNSISNTSRFSTLHSSTGTFHGTNWGQDVNASHSRMYFGGVCWCLLYKIFGWVHFCLEGFCEVSNPIVIILHVSYGCSHAIFPSESPISIQVTRCPTYPAGEATKPATGKPQEPDTSDAMLSLASACFARMAEAVEAFGAHEISDGAVVGKLMDILYNWFIVMSSDGLINQIKYCDVVVCKAYGLIYLDLDPRNCPAFFAANSPPLSQPKTPIQRCRCVTWEWFIPCGRATWNAP